MPEWNGADGSLDKMRTLVAAALEALDIRNLVLGIQDPSFPSEPDEDTGRGTPYSRGAARFLVFIRELGFTGIQLGPQGQTSESNASPYDSTLFSRNMLNVPLAELATEEWGKLLDADFLHIIRTSRPDGGSAGERYRFAFRAQSMGLSSIWSRFQEKRRSRGRDSFEELVQRFEGFAEQSYAWLRRDALFEALCIEHQQRDWRRWRTQGAAALDARLLTPAAGEHQAAEARRDAIVLKHKDFFHRYAFGQFLVHAAHQKLRTRAADLGLKLYGDLQIGFSLEDAWAWQGLFLRNYLMGAPPSRTNPEGQPWNYPVLDPSQLFEPSTGAPGPVLRFMEERMDKMLAEYDGLRIDHPHGLVCPWVYRSDQPDTLRAVQNGARLRDSPHLPDHLELALYAIPTPEQIDTSVPRHADGWVRSLTSGQVDQYSVLFDTIVASARRHGRQLTDLLAEVLSTQPHPLQRVLARYGLGRFRVTQKANLDSPTDVYRSENAMPEDWVMVGTHDTPPLWRVAEGWRQAGTAQAQADYLAWRLRPEPEGREKFARDLMEEPGLLEHAKFADLFACPARNVMVFFSDLFGLKELFNAPGSVNEENWSLRVPTDYLQHYKDKLTRNAALNLPLALLMALRAKPKDFRSRHRELISGLEEVALELFAD